MAEFFVENNDRADVNSNSLSHLDHYSTDLIFSTSWSSDHLEDAFDPMIIMHNNHSDENEKWRPDVNDDPVLRKVWEVFVENLRDESTLRKNKTESKRDKKTETADPLDLPNKQRHVSVNPTTEPSRGSDKKMDQAKLDGRRQELAKPDAKHHHSKVEAKIRDLPKHDQKKQDVKLPKLDTKFQAKPDTKSQPKLDTKSQSKPDIKSQHKPDTKFQPKLTSKISSKELTQSKADSKKLEPPKPTERKVFDSSQNWTKTKTSKYRTIDSSSKTSFLNATLTKTLKYRMTDSSSKTSFQNSTNTKTVTYKLVESSSVGSSESSKLPSGDAIDKKYPNKRPISAAKQLQLISLFGDDIDEVGSFKSKKQRNTVSIPISASKKRSDKVERKRKSDSSVDRKGGKIRRAGEFNVSTVNEIVVDKGRVGEIASKATIANQAVEESKPSPNFLEVVKGEAMEEGVEASAPVINVADIGKTAIFEELLAKFEAKINVIEGSLAVVEEPPVTPDHQELNEDEEGLVIDERSFVEGTPTVAAAPDVKVETWIINDTVVKVKVSDQPEASGADQSLDLAKFHDKVKTEPIDYIDLTEDEVTEEPVVEFVKVEEPILEKNDVNSCLNQKTPTASKVIPLLDMPIFREDAVKTVLREEDAVSESSSGTATLENAPTTFVETVAPMSRKPSSSTAHNPILPSIVPPVSAVVMQYLPSIVPPVSTAVVQYPPSIVPPVSAAVVQYSPSIVPPVSAVVVQYPQPQEQSSVSSLIPAITSSLEQISVSASVTATMTCPTTVASDFGFAILQHGSSRPAATKTTPSLFGQVMSLRQEPSNKAPSRPSSPILDKIVALSNLPSLFQPFVSSSNHQPSSQFSNQQSLQAQPSQFQSRIQPSNPQSSNQLLQPSQSTLQTFNLQHSQLTASRVQAPNQLWIPPPDYSLHMNNQPNLQMRASFVPPPPPIHGRYQQLFEGIPRSIGPSQNLPQQSLPLRELLQQRPKTNFQLTGSLPTMTSQLQSGSSKLPPPNPSVDPALSNQHYPSTIRPSAVDTQQSRPMRGDPQSLFSRGDQQPLPIGSDQQSQFLRSNQQSQSLRRDQQSQSLQSDQQSQATNKQQSQFLRSDQHSLTLPNQQSQSLRSDHQSSSMRHQQTLMRNDQQSHPAIQLTPPEKSNDFVQLRLVSNRECGEIISRHLEDLHIWRNLNQQHLNNLRMNLNRPQSEMATFYKYIETTMFQRGSELLTTLRSVKVEKLVMREIFEVIITYLRKLNLKNVVVFVFLNLHTLLERFEKFCNTPFTSDFYAFISSHVDIIMRKGSITGKQMQLLYDQIDFYNRYVRNCSHPAQQRMEEQESVKKPEGGSRNLQDSAKQRQLDSAKNQDIGSPFLRNRGRKPRKNSPLAITTLPPPPQQSTNNQPAARGSETLTPPVFFGQEPSFGARSGSHLNPPIAGTQVLLQRLGFTVTAPTTGAVTTATTVTTIASARATFGNFHDTHQQTSERTPVTPTVPYAPPVESISPPNVTVADIPVSNSLVPTATAPIWRPLSAVPPPSVLSPEEAASSEQPVKQQQKPDDDSHRIDHDIIDLTWLDDVDPEDIAEEINWIPIKVESNESQSRDVVSPVDSGLGSPQVEIDGVCDNAIYRCRCGQEAVFVCECIRATYCSLKCQLNDWMDHEPLCKRHSKS